MNTHEILAEVRRHGARLEAEADCLVLTGTVPAELRQAIREGKPELLGLLAAEAEARAESEAIRWADAAGEEADEALEDLAKWFDELPGIDEALSRCRHEADPRRGSWHWRDGRLCCRWCGGLWETRRSPVAQDDDTLKAKSPTVAPVRLLWTQP
jgi:hypothetical protein